MENIYKLLLENNYPLLINGIKPFAGKVRLTAAGLFSYLVDACTLALSGKFYIQFNVPASASLVGTLTFTEVKPFNAGNTTVVSVENNDSVNAGRFIVEVEGCFSSAVVAGAGVTAEITFIGYCVAL